jgi:hypothetical protein
MKPRNIFSSPGAKSEPASVLPEDYDVSFMAAACILCGSQRQYVAVEGPRAGDERWVITPAQARQLAKQLERVADEVEAENGTR